MLGEHRLVVHFVDVVAGQHNDVAALVVLDDVKVLVHGIRGAEIGVAPGDALARRQHVQSLIAFRSQEAPATLQVADQAVRLILRRYGDATDAGVYGVRQRKIDNARLPAEINRRLGPAVGEFQEPTAAPARKDEGKRAAGIGSGADRVGVCHGRPRVGHVPLRAACQHTSCPFRSLLVKRFEINRR